VLFAGPPGTGKTTAAQFVGHAWNNHLATVVSEIPRDAAPVTTVGNSAWSPFHTIGGLLPDEHGRYRPQRGIFIEPSADGNGHWRLRAECLVLDEMNRADLDRCIGELYPLLTRSVEAVRPAGIPGVDSIRLSPEFRLVGTVNDATLDDVVFPISEGLARRFVRIELPGARQGSLKDVLASTDEARMAAALQAVDDLFTICRKKTRMKKTDLGEHAPFGVAYFLSLRDWCGGRLKLSSEFAELDVTEQAHIVLCTALAGVQRSRGLDAVIQEFAQLRSEA
jgi:MoxR-like ATPase